MRRRYCLILFAFLVVACTPAQRETVSPHCDFRNGSVLLLAAQSVPSAALIPCIDSLPAGWSFRDIEVGQGETRFRLDSDRFGEKFLEVTLTPRCDRDFEGETHIVAGGITQRSIQAYLDGDRYHGAWYFSFGDACVTYRFAATGELDSIAADTEQALSFVTRASIDRFVRNAVDIGLDP